MLYDNILQTIGNTPMVRINHAGFNGRLYAKLENFNPGGSIKDRIALNMIEEAEETGMLKPGMTILEATSGNTGIGLALAGAVKGYPVTIVMSEGVSEERKKILTALSAKLIFSPGALSTDGAIVLAEKIRRSDPDKYFMPDQFSNPANPATHIIATAREILHDLGGKADIIMASMGTTGTIMGLSHFFKNINSNIEIIGVRPEPGEKIDGIKNTSVTLVPAIYDEKKVDRIIELKRDDAINAARRLMREEGIMAGISSGAVYAAFRKIKSNADGKTVAMIFADTGYRYMNSELFDPYCITAEHQAAV